MVETIWWFDYTHLFILQLNAWHNTFYHREKKNPMHVTPLVEPFLFSAVGDPTLANSNLPFREPLSFRQILEEELGTTTVGRKPCVKKFRKTRHPWICDAIHKSLGCHLVDAPNGKWGQAKENQSTLISLKQHLVINHENSKHIYNR